MTIQIPDVSRWTPNVDISPFPAVIARSGMADGTHGQGQDERDTSYVHYRDLATSLGKIFAAYHWLNHGKGKACAAYAYSITGGAPMMIDGEDVAGNTGYAGSLVVQDFLDFAAEYRTLGGPCNLAYLPHWYWEGHMGSPSLTPLADAGLHLVSSNYPSNGYTETGPGWAGYGGVDPTQWQFTSKPFDLNAFRGTEADYAALLGAAVPVHPIGGPGYEMLLEDGVWGDHTTRRLQQYAGTPVDGVLSRGVGQSSLTMWLQKQLNLRGIRDEHGARLVEDGDGYSFLPQDGHHTHSIAALERAMGNSRPDAFLSNPSACVRTMQGRLNRNALWG